MTDRSFRVSPDTLRRYADGPVQSYADGTREVARTLSVAAATPLGLPQPWAEVETRLSEAIALLERVGREAMGSAEQHHDRLLRTAAAYEATEQTNRGLADGAGR